MAATDLSPLDFGQDCLFLVAISASVKAFRETATASQFKTGMFIATVAYAAILWLTLL